MEAAQQNATFTFACRSCNSPITVGPQNRMYQFYIVRCGNCGLPVEHPLPTIRKKIIYLDQNVLSHILSGRDQRWQEVYRRLKLLSYLQVVTCPYSNIHRDESLLAEHSRDQLKSLYRELSDGNKFRSPFDIEQNQLLRSIRRYLGQEDDQSPAEDDQYNREFCEEDPNCWTLDNQVYADFPTDLQAVARMQQRKDEFQSDLAAVANNWAGEDGQRFKEDVERESLAYGRSMMKIYRKFAGASNKCEAILPAEIADVYRQCTGGGKFDPTTPPGVQPEVRLVHWLACEVHTARPEEPDPASVVEQFFESDEAKNTPFNQIASHLWAGVAHQARTKRPRTPEGNDKNDISAISHYAPYCDAMIVDNYFRGLATQRNIDVPRRFHVELFSAKTLPAFIDYLDKLLTNIPLDHRKAIKAVIPNIAQLLILKTE